MAIVHYNLAYNDNPYSIAQIIRDYGSLEVWDRHQRRHTEKVADDCIIELFDGTKMPVKEFVEQYTDKPKVTKKSCQGCVFCAADGFGKYHCSYNGHAIVSSSDFANANQCEQYEEE